jgi:hypothetical protein
MPTAISTIFGFRHIVMLLANSRQFRGEYGSLQRQHQDRFHNAAISGVSLVSLRYVPTLEGISRARPLSGAIAARGNRLTSPKYER